MGRPGIDLKQLTVDIGEILTSGAGLGFITQGHGKSYVGGGIDLHIEYLRAMSEIADRYESASEAEESDLPDSVAARLRENQALARRHRQNLDVLFASKRAEDSDNRIFLPQHCSSPPTMYPAWLD